MKLHLMRSPLPWRPCQQTQCGLLAFKVKVVAEKEFVGKDRCSICVSSVHLERGPNALLGQVEAAILRGRTSYKVRKVPTKDRNGMRETRRRVDDPILFELKAFAEMAERHREEFDSLVAAAMTEYTLQNQAHGGG